MGKGFVAFACALVFLLTPSQSFAATQTEYRTEGGERVGYQKITVDGTVFKDVNGALGGDLTKDNEAKLASKIIGQWSPVAVDVFDADTSVWGLRNAPTYINSMALDFAQSFKHTGNETDRKIDLKAWLADPDARRIDTDSQMKSTGLKKAGALSGLRVDMADHIAECLEDVYGKGKSAMTADAILNAGYSKLPNHKALDRLLEETDGRDVYYSMVTSINRSNILGVPQAYYNSYAVAVYDVTLSPVISESKDGLEYVRQKEKNAGSGGGSRYVIAKVNDTGEVLTTNVKLENTLKQTMANSMDARESGAFAFADPVGDSRWNELPFLETIGSRLLRSTDPVRAMNSSEDDWNTNEEHNYVYKNVSMPEDTCLKARRSAKQTWVAASYNAPYAVEYKVAVISLSGEIGNPADAKKMNHSYYGDYCALFDRNAAGAVENLKLRTSDEARQSSSYENNYGDTGGYIKDSSSVSAKIRWFDKTMGATGSGRYYETIMGRQSGNIDKIVKTDRMLTGGDGAMKLDTERVEDRAADDFTASYPLTRVTTSWQHDTGRELLSIRLNRDRAWNLSAVALQAYNDNDNPYYGFDASAFGGDWVVCNKEGTEIDPSESPLDILDMRVGTGAEGSGTQILLTEREGTGYIRWKIGEGIVYENGLNPVVRVGRDTTPSKPIEITVLPPADPNNTVLELIADGELSVPAGEDLDLNEHIVSRLRAGDETEVVPGRFFVKGNASGAQISPEGVFSGQTPGEYQVEGAMMVDESTLALTSTNSVKVTVTEKRTPGSIAVSQPPEGELSPVCSKVGYELLPLVSVLDNYGEPWAGSGAFDFNFKGGGKSIEGKASIADSAGGPRLTVTAPGTYEVVASYEEGDAKISSTITFVVHQIIGIPDPVPVKNLTYNGKPQTGVVGAEGCQLTDEKATEAGVYKARAVPAAGYAWLDGSTDEKLIPYRIHEARVEMPEAKDLQYNGRTQTAVADGFGYTVEGGRAKDAGAYSAKATPLKSCRWEDGTRGAVVLDYTVAAAPITIRAEDKSSRAGDALKALTYRVSGAYVKGDDLGVSVSTDAKKDRVGTYAIRVSWKGNKNYRATLVNGKYTVTAAPAPAPDPAPAKVSGMPTARMTAKGKTGLTIRWNRIEGAAGYDIFFARCNHHGRNIACKRVKSIKGNETFKWTKKGLKKKTAYKAYVKAYVMKNGKKSYVRTSPMLHAYTGKGMKNCTNARSVTIKNVRKGKVTLKKGGTFKIKAKVKKVKKNRKLMPKSHAAKLRYMTSDSRIATVSAGGRITAKGKGTCTIVAFAHNGVSRSIKVVVK